MKMNRLFFSLVALLVFVIACRKEVSLELNKPPLVEPTPVDTTATVDTTVIITPPTDTTVTTPPTDTVVTPPQPISITIQNPGFED